MANKFLKEYSFSYLLPACVAVQKLTEVSEIDIIKNLALKGGHICTHTCDVQQNFENFMMQKNSLNATRHNYNIVYRRKQLYEFIINKHDDVDEKVREL